MIIVHILVCLGCLFHQGDAYTTTLLLGNNVTQTDMNTGDSVDLVCVSEGADLTGVKDGSIPVIISKTFEQIPQTGLVDLQSEDAAINVSTGTNLKPMYASFYSVAKTETENTINYTLTISSLDIGDTATWQCTVGNEFGVLKIIVPVKPETVDVVFQPMATSVPTTTVDADADAGMVAASDSNIISPLTKASIPALPGNTNETVKTFESGKDAYVGCYVFGGNPQPNVDLCIAGEFRLNAGLTVNVVYTEEKPGFKYVQFRQQRGIPDMLFNWRHDEKLVVCNGMIIGRMDLEMNSRVKLDVQGKPVIIASRCKDIIVESKNTSKSVVCSIYCNPACESINITDVAANVLDIGLTPAAPTYNKDGVKGSVVVPATFDYTDRYGSTNPSKIWTLELAVPQEPKYLSNYNIVVKNSMGNSIRTIHVILPGQPTRPAGTDVPGEITSPSTTTTTIDLSTTTTTTTDGPGGTVNGNGGIGGVDSWTTTSSGTTEVEAQTHGNTVLIIGIVVSLLVVGGIVGAILLTQKKKKPVQQPARAPSPAPAPSSHAPAPVQAPAPAPAPHSPPPMPDAKPEDVKVDMPENDAEEIKETELGDGGEEKTAEADAEAGEAGEEAEDAEARPEGDEPPPDE